MALKILRISSPPSTRRNLILPISRNRCASTSLQPMATVFRQLENDHLPLLYHCTGGADRTGVFSAMLLLTLGVPEETVLADYALTTQYMKEDSAAKQKMMASAGSALSHLSAEQREVLMAADPA